MTSNPIDDEDRVTGSEAGASADADRAVVNGAASVSALRASVPSAGKVTWHCSEDDGGPDVGFAITLPDGSDLWFGEITRSRWEVSGADAMGGTDAGWWAIHYPLKGSPNVLGKCLPGIVEGMAIERLGAAIRHRQPSEDLVEDILYFELDAREAGHGYASREWAEYIAQAIEARRAETGTGSVHESAVAKPCVQPEQPS